MALADNLVAAWELDEASGNALDSVGSSTLTDQNTVGSGTGLVNDTARDFEADNSEYFSCADNADVSFGDVDWSAEVWVKWEGGGGIFPVVFSKGPFETREYVLYLSGGAPNWQVGTTTTATWGSALTTGTWYQIIVWHDSVNNQIGIVVNAGTPVTASYSSGGVDGTGDFQLGASTNQSFFWDGLISPFRIWKGRVLSSDERTDLFNTGAGRTLAYITGGGGGGSAVGADALHYYREHVMRMGGY